MCLNCRCASDLHTPWSIMVKLATRAFRSIINHQLFRSSSRKHLKIQLKIHSLCSVSCRPCPTALRPKTRSKSFYFFSRVSSRHRIYHTRTQRRYYIKANTVVTVTIHCFWKVPCDHPSTLTLKPSPQRLMHRPPGPRQAPETSRGPAGPRRVPPPRVCTALRRGVVVIAHALSAAPQGRAA
jgi:hypothetical protein